MLLRGIHVPDDYRKDRRIEIIDPLKMPPLPDVGRLPAKLPYKCSYTSVGGNSAYGAGAATTITTSVAGVSTGDLVIVFGANDGSAAISTIADSSSSFTLRTGYSVSSMNARSGYLLSSVATGTVTYTVTFASSIGARFIGVWVFTPTSTASFDTDANGSDVFSSSMSSGNISTTGSDIMCVGAGLNTNGVPTSMSIGGSAATGSSTATLGGIWYKAGAVSAGAATANPGGNARWVCSILSFNIAAGATGFGPPLGLRRNNPVAAA